MDFLDQLYDCYLAGMKTLSKDDKWIAYKSLHNKEVFSNRNQLKIKLPIFGNDLISNGLGCYSYTISKKDETETKKSFEEHWDYNYKLLHSMSGFTKKDLSQPNICKIYGELLDNGNVVPTKSYALGYYIHQIKKHTKSDELNVVLEIGGGWGLLSYLFKKLINPNVKYIMVDLPTTYVMAIYFLHECGLKIGLYDINIKKRIDKETISNYDIIILPPSALKNVSANLCDICISSNCLPEIGKTTIDMYMREIIRLNPKYIYVIGTYHCNGIYLKKCLENFKNYNLFLNQRVKVSGYIPYIKGITSKKSENEFICEYFLKLNQHEG